MAICHFALLLVLLTAQTALGNSFSSNATGPHLNNTVEYTPTPKYNFYGCQPEQIKLIEQALPIIGRMVRIVACQLASIFDLWHLSYLYRSTRKHGLAPRLCASGFPQPRWAKTQRIKREWHWTCFKGYLDEFTMEKPKIRKTSLVARR